MGPIILHSQHILQKCIELPENCDSVISVAIQGILTERDVDWELTQENETYFVSWNRLELENIVRVNDKILINYYRR